MIWIPSLGRDSVAIARTQSPHGSEHGRKLFLCDKTARLRSRNDGCDASLKHGCTALPAPRIIASKVRQYFDTAAPPLVARHDPSGRWHCAWKAKTKNSAVRLRITLL
jgi:hypothetical protein